MYSAHGYDFVQWSRGDRGLYESNYLKANSPDGRRAFWIKHNILAPADARHPAVLELWCVWYDRDAGRPVVLEQYLPMDKVAAAKGRLRIEGEQILLTDRETRTTLRQADGAEASWDLRLAPSEPIVFHFPSDRYYTLRLPKKKLTTPAPRVRFDGWLEVGGVRHSIDGWTGLRGHNWGSEHAWAYAYGNCNLFREDPEALIDMFTAKIRLGPVKSPWLSMAVLRAGGREHAFRSLRRAVTRDAVVVLPRWHVTIGSEHGPLQAEWRLDPSQTAGLRYLHPDGKVSYCYNTKFAELTLRVGEVVLTSDQGELEFLYPEPVEGLPLAGRSELPGM
jgi:hypothetical protein